jgi:hypothetical protein
MPDSSLRNARVNYTRYLSSSYTVFADHHSLSYVARVVSNGQVTTALAAPSNPLYVLVPGMRCHRLT